MAVDELVRLINTKLILSASRFFHSSSMDTFLIDDDISAYKHKISTNKALHRSICLPRFSWSSAATESRGYMPRMGGPDI
jgi:hypothetical protein